MSLLLETYNKKKEKATKVRVIALDVMNKNPFKPNKMLRRREKTQLLELMQEWFNKDDSIVDREFGEVISEHLCDPKTDYTELCIPQGRGLPERPPCIDFEHIEGKIAEVKARGRKLKGLPELPKKKITKIPTYEEQQRMAAEDPLKVDWSGGTIDPNARIS